MHQKFNNDFNCKDFFPIPEPLIGKKFFESYEFKGWKKKMSKSDASDYSRIDLADTEDEIIKKIKKLKQTLSNTFTSVRFKR